MYSCDMNVKYSCDNMLTTVYLLQLKYTLDNSTERRNKLYHLIFRRWFTKPQNMGRLWLEVVLPLNQLSWTSRSRKRQSNIQEIYLTAVCFTS